MTQPLNTLGLENERSQRNKTARRGSGDLMRRASESRMGLRWNPTRDNETKSVRHQSYGDIRTVCDLCA